VLFFQALKQGVKEMGKGKWCVVNGELVISDPSDAWKHTGR